MNTIKFGGCLAPKRPPPRVLNGNIDTGMLPEVDWSRFMSVVDDQQEGSCVGRGLGTNLEIDICRQTGERWQLDSFLFWRHGREMFYRGNLNGGLLLDQGVASAVDLEVIPPGCATQIPLDREAINEALQAGPLMQAHSAHDGWMPDRLHPTNGAVDESVAFSYGENGHCTAAMGWDHHNGREMVTSANSWGVKCGPLNGIFTMTFEHWMACALDRPMRLMIPKGWWTKTHAWRKFIVGPGTMRAPR
jgi:hypothetical protein